MACSIRQASRSAISGSTPAAINCSEKSRKALSQFLRPEFLGRVDEVITFKPLSEETLQGIAALMLDERT